MEKILKRKKRRINKILHTVYELKQDGSTFVIECTQHNLIKGATDKESVRLENAKKRIARDIFKIVVRNEVLEGTLQNVIEDQMC